MFPIDRTREADLAALDQHTGFSLGRIAFGLLVLGSCIILPVVAIELLGPFATMAFPGGPLLWQLYAVRFPRGRGFLWRFGRGRSPSQSIARTAFVTVAIALGGLLLRHYTVR